MLLSVQWSCFSFSELGTRVYGLVSSGPQLHCAWILLVYRINSNLAVSHLPLLLLVMILPFFLMSQSSTNTLMLWAVSFAILMRSTVPLNNSSHAR